MKGTKKVIILDNLNSKTISHAIFILKNTDKSEFSALEEAERIVEEYTAGQLTNRKHSYLLPCFAIAGVIIALILCLYFKL